MSVELEPTELGFRRPFTKEVAETLRLSNPHKDAVAFKVKTTAPKQYCVRPNSGRIPAGQSVEVQVLLQAMKEDPPLDTRCRDKFLVQSVAINSGHLDDNIHEIWQQIEATAKSSIQEKKIRVVFLAEHGVDDSVGAGDSSFISQRSPSPTQAHTPRSPHHINDAQSSRLNSIPPPPYENGPSAVNGLSHESQRGSSGEGVLNSVMNAVPTSSAELQRKLDDATATISRLREQVAQQGLRQRKGDAISSDSKERASSTSTSTAVAPTSNGVPVQIVAGLCLACFLVAYFLF